MNSRLRLRPPKQTLAARSGNAMKPIGWPAGLNTLTPSSAGLMPQPHHKLPSTSTRGAEKAPPAGGVKGLILMQWGCPDVRNPTPIKYQIGCTARGRLAFKENKV